MLFFLLRRQRSAAIKSNGDVFPRALAANHLSCRLASTLKSSFLFPFLDAAVPVPRPGQQRFVFEEGKKFVLTEEDCYAVSCKLGSPQCQIFSRLCEHALCVCLQASVCMFQISGGWPPPCVSHVSPAFSPNPPISSLSKNNYL